MVVVHERCQVCGKIADFLMNDGEVLLREAKCNHCGASLRNSDVAGEIIRYVSGEQTGLFNQQKRLGKYKMLNACSSGYIHNALKKLDNYICSEFFGDIPVGNYYEGVLCVDLCNMPFSDNTFDIIITEDVFEHIIDYDMAMAEIYRVLKPGGCHIFTVPLHDGHKTMNRERKKEVYHGDPLHADSGCLVITDWGDDIKDIVEQYGYHVDIIRKHDFYSANEITVVDESYDEYLAKRDNLNAYLKYNSTVIVAYKGMSADSTVNNRIVYSLEQLEEILQRKEKEVVALNRNIRDKNDIIKNLNDDNERRGKHILELDQKIEEKCALILELQKENNDKNIHIKKLDSDLEKSGNTIRTLQQENADRNHHINYLDLVVTQREHQIQEYNSEIETKNNQIEAQKQLNDAQLDQIIEQSEQIKKQTEQILKQAMDIDRYVQQNTEKTEQIKKQNVENAVQKEIIEQQEKDLSGYWQRIAELEQTIKNKEGHIELLLEVERAYEREKKTHSYKAAKRMKKCGDFLLPPNSRRRFFTRLIVNIFRHPIVMFHVINITRIKNYMNYMRNGDIEGVKRGFETAVRTEKMSLSGTEVSKVPIIPVQDNWRQELRADEFDKIMFQKFREPMVSIVIPVYNEFQYTYNCLVSILKNSEDIAYEVIIADDGSTDLTKNITDIVSGIKVVTTKKNLRFLLNCNHAAKYAKGTYILFLNNDTQVQENWLQPLIQLMESDDKIGMVGSKLIYPDGYLQEAGGILWKDGSAWNYGNRKNPEDPEFNYVKEVDYISGAAIMIRKNLWEAIGGFDERFSPAYCEDSDLAFSVRAHGYKVMYQPLSVVIHFEGISNGTDISSGQKKYQLVNQQKFLEKWKTVLEKEHFLNAENVFVARDRNRNKPVLLMIDHYVPQYDKDAGSRTVFQYLKMFVDKGYNVKFIGDNFYRHEPYTTTLQQMGIEVLYGSYYAQNWKKWIKENKEYFQYIFLNRPHISVNYIDFIRENTKAKIIYYGHDLHFLRELRKYELTHDKQALTDSNGWKEKEFSLMKKADIIYYPSSIETDEIKKIDKSIKTKAIVAYIFEQIEMKPYNFKKRKDIMFVGGFTHTPNVDAVIWFSEEVMPKIIEEIPDIKWYVMGSNPPQKIVEMASDNIIIKGFVSDEELERYYNQCRMSIVPLRYGAGIKGKVIEAMRYGIPVVTTSVGAEGIMGAENILCIADDVDVLAREIIAKYKDKEYLEQISSKSYEYIKNNFSQENAWDVIKADFL